MGACKKRRVLALDYLEMSCVREKLNLLCVFTRSCALPRACPQQGL